MAKRPDNSTPQQPQVPLLTNGRYMHTLIFLGLATLLVSAFLFAYRDTTNVDNSEQLPEALYAQIQTDSERTVRQRLYQSDGSDTVIGLRPGISHRVGLISGHLGNDSGAVCEDETGLYEVDVVNRIAEMTKAQLEVRGILVDILEEYDDRMIGYRANAVVSLHADMCREGVGLTGYKSAAARNESSRLLQACVNEHYGNLSGLPEDDNIYHLTVDMTNYHAFREVHRDTPIIILETGYLYHDRAILTDGTLPARAIANGILCYLGL